MSRKYLLDVSEDDSKTHKLQTWQSFDFCYEKEMFLIFHLCGLIMDLPTGSKLFESYSRERRMMYLGLPFHCITLMPVTYLFNQHI